MADYLLIYTGGSMPESEAEQATVMQAWNSWFGSLGSAVKDGGNPTTMSKTINADGSVTDGPIGTAVSGYSIIQADSLDDAVAKAKGCPVLLGGASIQVYETLDVMAAQPAR